MTKELSKGFTGIEINGVRFSNISEMLQYMGKQRERIAELEKACDETQELLDKQIEATYKLDKENAELKEQVNEWLNAYSNTSLVKVLRDCIYKNEKLSSQEQQELCAWIECAIDFGENLDECAKELEEANKANEWHYVKDELPPENVPLNIITFDKNKKRRLWEGEYKGGNGNYWTGYFNHYIDVPYAWKEIVLPKESE